MADLVSVQEGLPIRITGVSSTGGIPDNFADVNSSGSLQVAGQGVAGTPAGGVVSIQGVASGTAVPVSQSTSPWVTKDQADGPVTPGTAASFSQLIGGQYNSTLPTLTTGQQSALQLTSTGALITTGAVTLPYDENYGTVGANTLRVAAQIGNATGAASFGSGVTGAQTLRVAANTYDGSGNAISSQTLSTNQWLDVVIPSIGPTAPGTAASFSDLVGGQYNTAFPTLTNTQQSAIQVDVSGRVIEAPLFQTVAATFTSNGNSLAVNGGGSVFINISGTWVGSIALIGYIGGVGYNIPYTTLGSNTGTYTVSNITGSGAYQVLAPAGYTNVELIVQSWTSGSAAITMNSGVASSNIEAVQLNQANLLATVYQGASPWTTSDAADGPVSPGTAATKSILTGGQYNSTLPTLTTGQQSAIQLDSSGRIINGGLIQTVTGTITAGGQNVTAFSGGSVLIEVSGTWVGTLEISGGIGSSAFGVFVANTNGATPLAYTYSTITTTGLYKVMMPAAFSTIVVEALSWTSGTATITINSGAAADVVEATQLNQANLLATVYQGGSWSVTATNPSVTFIGNPPPSEATYIAGSVTTTAPTYTTGELEGLSLTTAGALRVDGSGVTQPVSGTVTANQGTANATPWNINVADFGGSAIVTGTGASGAGIPRVTVSNDSNILATQSGTWTVQPGNTANTTPWLVTDSSDGPVTPGTVATKSSLAGGQYNSLLPTLTTGQQAALQVDSSGRLLTIANASNFPTTVDTNYGTVGASTLRTASQIGNATGAAAFGAGTTTAQVLRVVLPTDQTAIPASQSGTWTVQQGTPPWTVQGDSASGAAKAGNPVQIGGVFNTTQPTVTTGETVEAQSTARGALIVSTGVDNFNIDNITGTVSLPTGAATAANQATEITSLQLIDNIVGSGPGAGTAGTGSALVGGVFNTTLPTLTNGEQAGLQVTASGFLLTESAPVDGLKATYSATSAIGFASATAATDIFTITGSATKTIRILRVGFSAQVTTAGVVNILLIKKSAANSGGTSAAATAVPHDSSDAAATATVLNYTANPTTLGAAVGTVRAARMFIPTSGTDIADFVNEWDFGYLPEKCVVLRGTTQVLSINLNATTVAGGTWTCYVEWTEE